MKINAINEMTVPVYRELNPVDNRNLEKNAEKVQGTQAPEVKEPFKQPQAEKPEINDGRETIGISRDGDIAKASKAGLENMNEGLVLKKTPEPIRRNEPEDNKVKPDKDEADKTAGATNKPQSLIGYSKDELERLYLQGEINSNQLDKELERRDEIRGEKKEASDARKLDEKNEKKTNEEVAGAMEDNREYGVKQVTAQNEEVARSQKEAGNKQAEALREERQAERTAPKENERPEGAAAESRKQIITEEMDRDNRFVREMTVLAGAEEDTEIKSEALETAVENDRLKLMEQVFNADPATASNV